MKTIHTLLLIALVFVLGCFYAYYQYKTNRDYQPATFWQSSNESNQAIIDHSLWQLVLDEYLVSDDPSGVNLVDYQGLVDEPGELRDYLSNLMSLDPRDYNRAEQFAYWVNLYNALTMQVVVDHYPVDSILKISSGPLPSGPWDEKLATIAGQEISLNDIEHRILRAFWKEPRIHFAVNCASIGCPNVQARAFTSKNTASLLELAARQFLQHPRGLEITSDGLKLSSIFDWYQEDFGSNETEVLEFLAKYFEPEIQAKMMAMAKDVSYDYDWTLNDIE